jgi:Replication-relaxation
MSFAKKDAEILWGLFEFRYLLSSQLSLYTGRSVQVVRRRCRELLRLGMLVSLERLNMQERVWALGRGGWEWCAAELGTLPEKLPYSKKAARVESLFLRHTLMTNSVRIAFELGLRDHEHVSLKQSIAEFHIADKTAKEPWKKFSLWERVQVDVAGRKRQLSVRPDCALLLYPNAQGPNCLGAFLVEADRNTESIAGKLHEKLLGWRGYYDKNICDKQLAARVMRVLFVLENGNTKRRIEKIRQHIEAMVAGLGNTEPQEDGNDPGSFAWCFRFADASDLEPETIIDAPVWQDWTGAARPLFDPRKND